jgi:hypothetical protein
VSEIADQVCDGMLVTCAAVPLKYRDGLGGPRDVVGFIRHIFPSAWALKGEKLLSSLQFHGHLVTFTRVKLGERFTFSPSQ